MRFFKKSSPENINEKIKKAKAYNVDYKHGLNENQVKERTAAGLINKSSKTVSKSYFEIIFKNVFSILNVILFAVAITMLVCGLYKRLFFTVVLFLNIGISLAQDIKARKLVDKLSLISNPRALAIRDGSERDIPFDSIVLSDILVLKAGNTIPCDAILVYGSITVNESFLSGETDNVIKNVGDNVFAESYVTSGTAYIKVVKIGNANYAFKMQEKARSFSRPRSEILASLTKIIHFISIIAIAIGLMEIITYASHGVISSIDTIDALTSSIVAMIPAGMYLITSITLTVGVIILARKKILVRELYSIEMLARVNVICFDKTGTLTDGKMVVKNVLTIASNTIDEVGKIIGQLLYATRDDNLTAQALKNKFPTIKVDSDVSCIPFDSAKKYSAASFNKTTYALGAFGFLPLSNEEEIKHIVYENENKGMRVLVLASGPGNIIDNKLPKSLKAIAIIVLSENIKKDAKRTISWFKNCGVDMCVISGDSPFSLKAIAKEVGIENNDAVSLEGLSDEKVKEYAKRYKVFARVTPEQKRIIIEELRAMKKTVAMVGDGVNDLLALKAADCSIAMANGADAAKAVAHLIALNSDFASLPSVVEEGRKVINNIERVCSIFLVKTVFAAFTSLFFLVCSWFNAKYKYPYVSNNLLVWELLTIGFAPFLLALEPNKERIRNGFLSNVITETLPAAIIQIVITLPALMVGYSLPEMFPLDGIISMTVITLTAMSLIILFHVCMPLNRYRTIVLSTTLALSVGVIVADVALYAYQGGGVLSINYLSINTACLLLCLLMFIVSIPLYFALAHLFAKWFNKEKRQYEKGRTN